MYRKHSIKFTYKAFYRRIVRMIPQYLRKNGQHPLLDHLETVRADGGVAEERLQAEFDEVSLRVPLPQRMRCEHVVRVPVELVAQVGVREGLVVAAGHVAVQGGRGEGADAVVDVGRVARKGGEDLLEEFRGRGLGDALRTRRGRQEEAEVDLWSAGQADGGAAVA